ncbi:hypothetical protein EYF80_007683 [Liparis tanakae]|uniref:Uncharacterized protein n=1 Tax=Liparis tanakae TaxID=230148 RepID=A0A4Z2IWB2_9TELE|nr:hypothetical protein EYF80_007683 [Liparis tanakae]
MTTARLRSRAGSAYTGTLATADVREAGRSRGVGPSEVDEMYCVTMPPQHLFGFAATGHSWGLWRSCLWVPSCVPCDDERHSLKSNGVDDLSDESNSNRALKALYKFTSHSV